MMKTEKEIMEFLILNRETIRFDIEEHVRNFLKNEDDFKGVFSFAYKVAYLEFVSSCIIEVLMEHGLTPYQTCDIIDPSCIEDLLDGYFTNKEFYKKGEDTHGL